MKLVDFKRLLDGIWDRTPEYRREELTVRIPISKPSIGGSASVDVNSVSVGFDWDSGSIFISPKDKLVIKTKEEEIFDSSRELLMYLATKPQKRKTYEVEQAQTILKRIGYKDEDFEKYREFFHRK